jgi:hypothetical protein
VKIFSILALGVIALVGCSEVADVGSSNARQAMPSERSRDVVNFGSDCYNTVVGFNPEGGKVVFPGVAQGDNFYGHVYYAPFDGQDHLAEVVECPGSDNSYNVPVPSGYVPDLFENLKFGKPSLVFQPASLFGEIYSTTWVPKVKYILNVYDDQDNLLSSSEMGPLKKKKNALKFASPFENGFMIPSDGILNLEIAHPGQ